MNKMKIFAIQAMLLSIALSALLGCSHEAAFEKQRVACKAISNESERTRCMQKVETDETAYQRKSNETRIEKDYKRKLEDMKR
jgi:hypothetical protein